MTHADFIHLAVHSAYSLSEGAIKTKQLIELAKREGMPALGVADTGNLFGALEFSMAARAFFSFAIKVFIHARCWRSPKAWQLFAAKQARFL